LNINLDINNKRQDCKKGIMWRGALLGGETVNEGEKKNCQMGQHPIKKLLHSKRNI
jgi:hypothetical protein